MRAENIGGERADEFAGYLGRLRVEIAMWMMEAGIPIQILAAARIARWLEDVVTGVVLPEESRCGAQFVVVQEKYRHRTLFRGFQKKRGSDSGNPVAAAVRSTADMAAAGADQRPVIVWPE